MVAATDVNHALAPDDHARELRRAVVAATVGTTIEWYYFLLYSTMAGLVFGKLFFPNETPLAATLNSFAIYFVGFVARPIGAFIFGHYGDRVGRKSTLIVTLILMACRPSWSRSCPAMRRSASGARCFSPSFA
jgi:MFS family permease